MIDLISPVRLRAISDRLPCRVIDRHPDGAPYLERYFVAHRGTTTVYLHRFVGSDGDELHDHPWPWAASLILAGSYREHRMTAVHGLKTCARVFKPGSVNVLRGTDHHRVELLTDEVWTLFVAHGKSKGWGFTRKATPLNTNDIFSMLQPKWEVLGRFPTQDERLAWEQGTVIGAIVMDAFLCVGTSTIHTPWAERLGLDLSQPKPDWRWWLTAKPGRDTNGRRG